MNKPIILAICGKSAAGKNTLAKQLNNFLKEAKIPSRIILTDTTRPPRLTEIVDVDYHFVTPKIFLHNLAFERYLEHSKFNNWYYGTNKFQIAGDVINIGVFNPTGIQQLSDLQSFYHIIPIYMKVPIIKRLYRSWKRENKFKKEFIRRSIADFNDFNKFELFLDKNFKDYLILDKEDNLFKMSYLIYCFITKFLRKENMSLGKKV